MYIHNKGNPTADVWVILNSPLPNDIDKKYIFSSGLGFVFDKMMQEAGLNDYYVTCLFPDTAHPTAARNVFADINHYQPKIILPIDAFGAKLLPDLIPKRQGKNYDPEKDSEIQKYCGSLLRSPNITYPHYCMPLLHPLAVSQQYKLRDQVLLDLVKAKYELDYFIKNGVPQPLPIRKIVTSWECFDELLCLIDSFNGYEYISNDIETIYPRAKDEMYGKTPGYPVVAALAISKDYGISFDFFRESTTETRELWTALDRLFRNCKTIGQNFYNFDSFYYEMLGFRFREIVDTIIMHHTLWAQLPHSLQYMTRQYTREPYYKDEGQGWSIKNMTRLKNYNGLDACVTYEVWQALNEELEERPHLK